MVVDGAEAKVRRSDRHISAGLERERERRRVLGWVSRGDLVLIGQFVLDS